ncbi:restriction endonuclease subunit S [Faecalibacterium sp. An121]|uniref:restriction endonuclease subunit S n=1 Tax=Faecalibacterium sp. An121 TaxID=1965550 RepID=UPI000B367596|nr:restriction endonuclease subunit S [Faecalibacterium sp. An121]OUQ37231.1 hypothetical protein B5E66_08955 [Faecalibacterium sp. An121]
MTPQELKNSILQLAIQGKLVEQRPEEGTAQELYAQIQAEKQRLIKEGKLKKEKPLPEITEEEKPFEIPEGWMWCRLNDIVIKTIKRGKSPTYAVKSNILVFAQKCNTKAGYIDLSLAQFLDEAKLSKYPKEEFMMDNDIVLNSTGNGTLGRVGIYHSNDNPNGHPIVPDSHVTIIRTNTHISVKFAFYSLKYYQPYMEKLGSGSTNQTELSAGVVKALLFPLPPLAEQKRIVAKIEELLPLVDRYEQAWTKLEDFNRRFPEDMKKSILQQAIQGKLVEQRPEEGTAQELYEQIQIEKQRLIKEGKLKKEKPLPEITEEEKPFEIPEGWMWVRLGEICKSISDGDHQPPPQVPEGVPFLVISNVSAGRIDFSSTRYVPQDYFNTLSNDRIAQKGDILFTVTGSYGIPIKVESDEKFCFQRHIALLKLMLDWDYIFYILKSPTIKSQCDAVATGTAQKTVGLKSLRNLIVPLPPLAEQKRIVEKLEELLAVCERLKQK